MPWQALHYAQRFFGQAMRKVGGGMLVRTSPPIADLGVIGNRRTAAIVTRRGEIAWFCPGRFDSPSLLRSLLDTDVGGTWRIELPGAKPASRRYLGESAVLETTLRHPAGDLTITDWMPFGDDAGPHGAICRSLSPAPADLRIYLKPRPEDGCRRPHLRKGAPALVVIDERFRFEASHPVEIDGPDILVRIPGGACSWAVLSDGAAATLRADAGRIAKWRESTESNWCKLARHTVYDGPFNAAVRASLRALRLLMYEETGAIAAAVTTSLPEIVGGKRNYDYRYSWLRDSGIITRALCRFEPDCQQARRFVSYVAGLVGTAYQWPLDPVAAVGGERVPPQRKLMVRGYRGGQPNLRGNKAARQLQLGSLANFILAATELYSLTEHREGWDAAETTADFLSTHWQERGNGIWEETQKRHYTTSLALTACALERMRPYAKSEARSLSWGRAATAIRDFIQRNCVTAEGTFGVTPGSRGVDISMALFPAWGFVSATDPVMRATIAKLESEYGLGGGLLHRHLQHRRTMLAEGAFLAGTFWVAHYWANAGDPRRAAEKIETGLRYANDLGLFPEEIDPNTGEMLGNIPLGLVHGSFLAAVCDMQTASKHRTRHVALDRT